MVIRKTMLILTERPEEGLKQFIDDNTGDEDVIELYYLVGEGHYLPVEVLKEVCKSNNDAKRESGGYIRLNCISMSAGKVMYDQYVNESFGKPDLEYTQFLVWRLNYPLEVAAVIASHGQEKE